MFSVYTIYHLQFKNENHPNLSLICSYGIFSKGLKNEFETALVNEPSVFEPLKFYCNVLKIVTILKLDSLWMPKALFVISFVLSLLFSILYLVQVLLKLSTTASGSCSSTARAPNVTGKLQIGNSSVVYAYLSIMFFRVIRHNPFENKSTACECQRSAVTAFRKF